MKDKDEHYIQDKWVDCKSAVPISEMKNYYEEEDDEFYETQEELKNHEKEMESRKKRVK